MFTCLYKCGSSAPSTQKYHVYPASASTMDLILPTGVVCDKCNSYFSKLEKYFTERHPGASTRLLAVEKTRKGKAPVLFTRTGTAFRKDRDGKQNFTFPLDDLQIRIKQDGNIDIVGETKLSPFDATMISRVLAKIALESLWWLMSEINPFSEQFDPLRTYARFGKGCQSFIWFAYRLNQQHQLPPHLVPVTDREGQCIGKFSLIFFPGIQYLLSLLPIMLPSQLRGLEEWTLVTTPGMIERKSVDLKVELVQITEEEMKMRKDAF